MTDSITVRRMEFDFKTDMDLVFIEDDPGFSFIFLGTWMLLPYLEPYLMRTMRKAMEQVEYEKLAYEMKQFCSQEGQHYRQHAKANDLILAAMPATQREKMEQILAEVDREYRDFLDNKPLAWNLAYAEGFEAYTCAGARTQLAIRMFDYMKNPVRDLMLWHITEEVEHRTVAYDAYEALGNGYWYRLRWGFWAQKHFVGLGNKLAAIMAEAFPDLVRAHESPESIKNRKSRRRTYLLHLLRDLPVIYTPWYNPHRLRLPAMYEEARQEYDRRAVKTAA